MNVEIMRSYGKTIRSDVLNSDRQDDDFVHIKTELPVISSENENVKEHLNSYYASLIDSLIKSASQSGNNMNVNCTVTYSNDKLFSLLFDIKQYYKNELVSYICFSDIRREDGLVVPPYDVFLNARRLSSKGLVSDMNDWYITKKGIMAFKNNFEKGAGKGIRRSDEKKFIEACLIDGSSLRPNWAKMFE